MLEHTRPVLRCAHRNTTLDQGQSEFALMAKRLCWIKRLSAYNSVWGKRQRGEK